MNTYSNQLAGMTGLLAGFLACGAVMADPLPDLTITDLQLNQDCQIQVTVKNLGPGSLPETAFMTGTKPNLQFYKNNSPAGSRNVDERALQPAGGSYTYANTATNQVVSGSYTFRAVIDRYNIVNEANENNNEMTRSLSCTPSLPDLAITKVRFMSDCRARVTIKNVGTEVYPNNSFNLVNVSRTIDGAGKGYRKLTDIDPAGTLKQPGGTVEWTDFPDFKATSTAKYQLSGSGMSAEQNSANNKVTANIPSEGCGATVKHLDTKQQFSPVGKPRVDIKTTPRIKKRRE